MKLTLDSSLFEQLLLLLLFQINRCCYQCQKSFFFFAVFSSWFSSERDRAVEVCVRTFYLSFQHCAKFGVFFAVGTTNIIHVAERN